MRTKKNTWQNIMQCTKYLRENTRGLNSARKIAMIKWKRRSEERETERSGAIDQLQNNRRNKRDNMEGKLLNLE